MESNDRLIASEVIKRLSSPPETPRGSDALEGHIEISIDIPS